MCLVVLVEEKFKFVEALLYQSLTPTISLPNLSQRLTQFTVCLKSYKYGSLLSKYSNPGYDLCDIEGLHTLFSRKTQGYIFT